MRNRRASYNKAYHGESCEFTEGRHSMKRIWKEQINAKFNLPPVNVRETDNSYELYLFAAGYEKGDFIISLTDHVLSISVEEKKQDTEDNWKRQEYRPKGFVRQFELNEKTDKSSIVATYKNGVLILSLPKLEGFETRRKNIEVD